MLDVSRNRSDRSFALVVWILGRAEICKEVLMVVEGGASEKLIVEGGASGTLLVEGGGSVETM